MTAPEGLKRRKIVRGQERPETIWMQCKRCATPTRTSSDTESLTCGRCTQFVFCTPTGTSEVNHAG